MGPWPARAEPYLEPATAKSGRPHSNRRLPSSSPVVIVELGIRRFEDAVRDDYRPQLPSVRKPRGEKDTEKQN